MSTVQRFWVSVIGCLTLVAVTAAPANAVESGDDASATVEGDAVTVRVNTGEGKRPAGPVCKWGKWIKKGAFAEVKLVDSNGNVVGRRRAAVDSEAEGEDLVKVDEDLDSEDAESGDIFVEGIEDGYVDVNGENWRVFTGTCPGEEGSAIAFVPPRVDSLFPGVEAELIRRLPKPELILNPIDEENDWTFVQTPIDFRTTEASVEPVEVWLDSGGPPGVRQWIEVTAQPTFLVFKPGDPLDEGREVRCPIDKATAAYDPLNPLDECHHVYGNASSVAPDNEFVAELSLEWSVTYDSSQGSGTLEAEPTIVEESVRVAEIKAVTKAE